MAICVICNKHLGLTIKSRKLSDGKCCLDCLRKAGISPTDGRNFSSYDIRKEIEHWKAIELANSKIRKIYEKKISEITLTQNHCCYAIDTADFDNEYIYSIQNGYFNQIHDEWSYIKSYGIQDNIKVLSDIENITPKSVLLLSIPISCIQYFTKDGDVQYTTKVSGGGGGGSSISGAVIGGLVAGSTGAIIGSRGKIGSIYSTTEKHDTSKTILVFKNGSALETIVFKGHDMYNFLFNEIPEKDLLYVQLKGQPETSNQDNNIKEHLKTLKELFEDGLIKEEEYNEKKSELLKRL